jgi:hypothetical protein
MLLGRWDRRLASLCGALLACHALAGPVTVLRVAAQEGTEPKFMAGPQGGIVGLCIDIMHAIERIDPGLRFEGHQHWMPLVRVYHEASVGQQDAVCAMQRMPEREPHYRFVEPPLFNINYMLIARADDSALINNWDDVRKLGPQAVVLANRGFASNQVLEQLGGIQVDASAASTAMNLQKLMAGRGRFFLHRTPGLYGLLERDGVLGKVRILPTVMLKAPLYMALSRQVSAAVAERVRAALEQMARSGELDQLLKKWD